MRSRILLPIFLVFSASLYAQGGYNAWKEMGLQGKVRTLVTKAYSNARSINGTWVPQSEGAFDVQQAYFFSPYGSLDSVHYDAVGEDGQPVHRRIIYRYHFGKKAGYDEYAGAVTTETAGITWIDSLTYITRIENHEDGTNTHAWQTLNSSYRDFKSEVRVFDEGGKPVYCSVYENRFEGGVLVGARFTDCLSNESSDKEYRYQGLDAAGNALSVIMLLKGASEPEQLWVRRLTYY